MAKFRMKTVEYEAAQVLRLEPLGPSGNNAELATNPPGWLFRPERIKHWGVTEGGRIVITTSLGDRHIKEGDWIVQQSNGTMHVLGDDEFKAKYEPVPESPSNPATQCQAADGDQATLESLATDAFETIEKSTGFDWKSKRWKLILSLAREYRLDLNSDEFLDAIGLLLESLESRLFKQQQQPSPETSPASVDPTSESSSDEPLYYLQNMSVGCVGNSPQFWRQGDSGYTAWISAARKFTANEIEEIIRSTRGSHEFAAWHTETIDMIADKVVDMQELRGYKPSFTTRSMILDRQTEKIIDANGPTN